MRRDFFIYAFLALGLCRMPGTFDSKYNFNRFPRTLALSPNPSPFLAVRTGSGDERQGIWIQCNKGGVVTKTQWDYKLRSRLDMPERAIGFYIAAVSYFATEKTRPLASRIFPRLVCLDSQLSRVLGCGPGTEEVTLLFRSPDTMRKIEARNGEWRCASQL